MTAQNTPRLSLAALLATKPGHRPRLIYRTRRGRRRGDRRKGFTEADYAPRLDAAHQQLGGPIVLVWDNLNTHSSAAMAELIGARPWLTVFRLPPYAHELNPVEPVWSHLKRSLANLTKHTIGELTALVKTGRLVGCGSGAGSRQQTGRSALGSRRPGRRLAAGRRVRRRACRPAPRPGPGCGRAGARWSRLG